jgi:hypothetical protein
VSNEFEEAIHAAAETLSLHICAIENRRFVEKDTLSPEEQERLSGIICAIETVHTDLFEWLDRWSEDQQDPDNPPVMTNGPESPAHARPILHGCSILPPGLPGVGK